MLQRHPLSAAFPDMEAKDFAELVEDIRANGLIQAVVTLDGLVLDGWHRYRACLEAGAEPFFEVFRGDDPVAYVLSLNMHRRHLTGSQRAAAVVACSAWVKSGDNQHTRSGGAPEVTSGARTEAELAEAAGVSGRVIRQAKRAQEAGLGEAVRDGKVSAERAAKVAKLPEPERKAALEAPPAPKPAPKVITDVTPLTTGFGTPAAPDDRDARIAELQRKLAETDAQIADLTQERDEMKRQRDEAAAQVLELHEENESLHRILDGDDLLEGYRTEVKRVAELARVTESRVRGLMAGDAQLKSFVKFWRANYTNLAENVKKAMGCERLEQVRADLSKALDRDAQKLEKKREATSEQDAYNLLFGEAS